MKSRWADAVTTVCGAAIFACVGAAAVLGASSEPETWISVPEFQVGAHSPTTMLTAAPPDSLLGSRLVSREPDVEPVRTQAVTAVPLTEPWLDLPREPVAGAGVPSEALSVSEQIAKTWPHDAHNSAYRVMMCESGGDPRAHGDLHLPQFTDGYGSVGLFQINVGNILYRPMDVLRPWQTNDPRVAIALLMDPMVNIEIAHRIWQSSGETFRVHWVRCSR